MEADGAERSGPVDRVADRLERAVVREVQGSPRVSVAYSGGLDSSLVALLAARHVPTDLVVVGTRTSHDVAPASSGARRLGLPLTIRLIGYAEIRSASARWSVELEDADPLARSVAVATGLAVEAAVEPRVGMGQGADEFFFGYAHFLGLSSEEADRRARLDRAKLIEREWPRAVRIAAGLGHGIFTPFLDPEVIEAARAIPVEWHLKDGVRKAVLRAAARRLGLAAELCDRPKKAFQYGSGIDAALRRLRGGR